MSLHLPPSPQNGTGKQTRWHMDKVVLTNLSSSASLILASTSTMEDRPVLRLQPP